MYIATCAQTLIHTLGKSINNERWVGVLLDHPVGTSDGSLEILDSKTGENKRFKIFNAPPNGALFVPERKVKLYKNVSYQKNGGSLHEPPIKKLFYYYANKHL